MKDEIKEILDRLKTLCYDDYCLEFSVDYIERKEEKLLLDYITNLQKENEKLLKKSYSDDVIITKANSWIDKHIETYTKNNITIIDWDTFADPRQLKNILQGVNNDV